MKKTKEKIDIKLLQECISRLRACYVLLSGEPDTGEAHSEKFAEDFAFVAKLRDKFPAPKNESKYHKVKQYPSAALSSFVHKRFKRDGQKKVELDLGLSRHTLFRIIAGAPCHSGTLLLLTLEMEKEQIEKEQIEKEQIEKELNEKSDLSSMLPW